MILFILSFFMIFMSAYCFASYVEASAQTKTKPVLAYTFLFAFAEIILSFELLSLFSAINQLNFLTLNLFFLTFGLGLLRQKNIQLYRPQIKQFFTDIFKAIKRDKILFIPVVLFIFLLLLGLFIVIISPVSISDAMSYHVPRTINWLLNANLNHSYVNDTRMVTMPINSELVFAWIVMFFKSDVCLGMMPFFGLINTIVVLYCFLGELGFSVRKKLWSVLIFAALPYAFIEGTSLDTNTLTGSMVLTSVYLFYTGIKNKNNLLLFISSMSLAIACGIKTTALIAGPSVALVMLYISILFEKKHFYKPMLKLGGFLLLNFLIFSSYNYILNYINYHDWVTTQEQYELNKFRGGIKAYLSNLIKYFFMLFDFSGMDFMARFNYFTTQIQELCHILLGINSKEYMSLFFKDAESVTMNFTLLETKVGMGLLGIIAFFPALIISIFKYRKQTKSNNKKGILSAIALMYVFNILLFAGLMVYTGYNARYLITFSVISFPIIACTYIKSNKNVYKLTVIFIICYLMFFLPQKTPYRNINEMCKVLKNTHSVSVLRDKMRSSVLTLEGDELCECRLKKYLMEVKPQKTAYFSNYGDFIFPVDILRLYGYNIDILNLEHLENVNLQDYDTIIIHTLLQRTNNVLKFNDKNNIHIYNDGGIFYYDNKNSVACYYINSKAEIIKEFNMSTPIFTYCQTPFETIERLGFKLDGFFPSNNSINYNEPENDNKDVKDIVVYRKVQ